MATIEIPEADFLTAAEMARLLRLDVKTVRRHANELGVYRVGRSVRFPFPRKPLAIESQPPVLHRGGSHPRRAR